VRRESDRAAVEEFFEGLGHSSSFDASYDRAVILDLIDLAPPGLDELFAVLSILDALFAASGPARTDLVILDTAPTGHALRLLQMPTIARQWAVALIGLLLKYRQVAAPGPLAAELVELSRGLRQLQALLADHARSSFIVVTRPAELPIAETRRLIAALDRMKMTVPAVILNAITPVRLACRRCRRMAAREAGDITRLRRRMAYRRRRCVIIRTPAVAPPPTGVRALRRWTAAWSAPSS
jgi:arsenite-transporting ATPase